MPNMKPKKHFIEIRYKNKFKLPEKLIKELPENIVLAYTVQFKDSIKEILKQLKDKKVELFRSLHGKYKGQILGCDNYPQKKKKGVFLYIGDGQFHPTAINTELPIISYNPFSKKWTKINNNWQKENKRYFTKFLTSKTIGIIISTKPGQQNMKLASELKKQINKHFPEKEVYLFLNDLLIHNDLENFNFIDFWINTACPRIENIIYGRFILDYIKLIKN